MKARQFIRSRLGRTKLRAPLVFVRHFGLCDEDVFLASYPRSGNTWLKCMLGQLLSGDDVGFDRASELVPTVGAHRLAPLALPRGGRLIKTHEPFRHVYKNAVYLVRDGRDVAVSYYFYNIREGLFMGRFSQFLELFLKGRIGPYGSWHDHVLSWIGRPIRRPESLWVVKYESMLAAPKGELRKVADFVGLDVSQRTIEKPVLANTAEQMRRKEREAKALLRRRKPSSVPFVRKASSGQWRDEFNDRQARLFMGVAGEAMRRLGYS